MNNQSEPVSVARPASGEFEHGFDVYATPFVPEAIRRINRLDGVATYDTGPIKHIDYGEYIRDRIPFHHLPTPKPNSFAGWGHPTDSLPHPGPGPSQRDYQSFFNFYLNQEMVFQNRENASYSLYNHEAAVEFDSSTNAKVTVIVPGLRENSPYVEDDDPVELRQLRYDDRGHLQHPNLPPWTEIVYKSRVTGVLRAKETLVLCVSNLTFYSSKVLLGYGAHLPIPPQHRLRFNIQFPVPMERHRAMTDVLPQISFSLQQALSATTTYSSRPLLDPFLGSPPAPDCSKTNTNQYWVQSMIFPTEADCESQNNLASGHLTRHFFDDALNDEQRTAVEDISSQNYGVIPYLISGPPGTGKTKTIIEAAMQLINNVSNVNHILLCAPSEPASDTLADRLRPYLKPSELLRLNRPSRGFSEVADTLLSYCHIDGEMFTLPPMVQLLRYKVIVTSCRDASMLMYSRVTNSDLYAFESGPRTWVHPTDPPPDHAKLHWAALLIDEAAQSTEPEALVPLFVVAPPPQAPRLAFTPVVVMAGDEKQLTPRTSCPRTPLRRSLFARLFSRPVFANHPLARRLTSTNTDGRRRRPSSPPPTLSHDMLPILRPPFTNLIRNYRSHPVILAVPSQLFYYDTLQAHGDPLSTNKLLAWSEWPRRRSITTPRNIHDNQSNLSPTSMRQTQTWPILFHHNPSPDGLERDHSGWFNSNEAVLACTYARKLSSSGLVSPREICIMSPFKAQVRRIRQLARTDGFQQLWNVNIGPVEAFQGLEFDVVILGVTRAGVRKRFINRDRELGWGIIPGRGVASDNNDGTEGVGERSNGHDGGIERNKLNVALTRARSGLIIIADGELVRDEDPHCWGEVVGFYERNGCLIGGSLQQESGEGKTEERNLRNEERVVTS